MHVKDDMFRSPESILRPVNVAIVGASETGGAGWAANVHENLKHAGFPVELFLVNPRRAELWGRPCYPSLSKVPEVVDLAIVIVPAEAVVNALEDGVERGLKGAIIYAAQFGEGGDAAGASRGRRLRELSHEKGLRICGPNGMGALSLHEKYLFYPSPRVRGLPAGNVGVVFQSGGTFQYWLQQGAVRGLGFSYAVSSGNEIDLDLADYVNFLVADPKTSIIACMVEGIRRPEAFMLAAERALLARKPILMVKIGRSERAAAQTQSHTGALAGDDFVVDAMCRKYGIIRCDSLDEMIELALVFQGGRIPAGPRIAMACYSGGAKGLFLDEAEKIGLELAEFSSETAQALLPQIDPGLKPENPLDAGATPAVVQSKFSAICRTIAEDPQVDILALQGQLPMSEGEKLDPAVFSMIAASTTKPLVAISRLAQNVTEFGRAFQTKAGIPFVQGLPNGARALSGLARYGDACRRGIAVLANAREPSPLRADNLAATLAEYAITEPRSAFAPSMNEAVVAAREIGFPVALKIVSPQASHKTEVGGVVLALKSDAEVREAASTMSERLRNAVPSAEISGFQVQEMVSGLELLVGVRNDAEYGPIMVFGLGGIFVEAIRDVAFRLLPVTESDVEDMMENLRGRALFGSYRNRPEPDIPALKRAVAGLSRCFAEHRRVLSDLEINPLIVLKKGEGVRAVDIRTVWK